MTFYVKLALLALVLLGFGAGAWYLHHSGYESGVAAVTARNNAALVAAQKVADAKTAQLLVQSNKAHQEAADAIKRYQDYVAQYPLEPVRVRVISRAVGASADACIETGGTSTAGPGPGTGAQVLGGGAAQVIDLTPELGTILRGFADLGTGFREFQQRTVK